ncbi:HAD-IIIA family hydrolase [Opitutus sp. GAS368]|jgi:D-glycero-D-manno-heptose 1,7-bisphosphate phosphatase|uniref:D-glycero-alpha-D-manno-heptose-1,7-bisphosphate 7-phosphatase n=1 Tax=Opitutus sp. GAS368 TaxID=1882749 RepID=UPI00087BBCEF|nr:HAD-IIIA family hydrolase [Opitutus sp. GAS368]SDS25780.1 D-alpha,beta-D-heptose 1,7-bisphosphate phosphatase [Opitutus sp. GAS368]
MTKRRAVFLDRDGTLNAPLVREGRPYPPATVVEFQLLPGVAEGCRQLHAAGYVLVVATNQPDVGRGTQPQAVVEAMHAHLRQLIPEIARIEVCYAPGRGVGHPDDRRRKPEPGMLTDAAQALGLDLAGSWMIGDRWRDVDCGARAACRTVFIDRGYDEPLRQKPDFTARTFTEAAGIVLAQSKAIS